MRGLWGDVRQLHRPVHPDSASGYLAAAEVFRLVDQVSKIDATQPVGRVESIGDGSDPVSGGALLVSPPPRGRAGLPGSSTEAAKW